MRYLFFVAQVPIHNDMWTIDDPTSILLEYQCQGSHDFRDDPRGAAARFMEASLYTIPDEGFLMLVPAENLQGLWGLKANQIKTQIITGSPYFFKFNKRSMYDIQQVNH